MNFLLMRRMMPRQDETEQWSGSLGKKPGRFEVEQRPHGVEVDQDWHVWKTKREHRFRR